MFYWKDDDLMCRLTSYGTMKAAFTRRTTLTFFLKKENYIEHSQIRNELNCPLAKVNANVILALQPTINPSLDTHVIFVCRVLHGNKV